MMNDDEQIINNNVFLFFFSFDSKNLIFLFFSLLEKKTTTTTTIQESCHQHLQINHYHYHHHQKIVHQINSVVIMEIVYRNVGFVVCFVCGQCCCCCCWWWEFFVFFTNQLNLDFQKDCEGDEDENQSCPPPQCDPNQFTCGQYVFNKTYCIPLHWHCDKVWMIMFFFLFLIRKKLLFSSLLIVFFSFQTNFRLLTARMDRMKEKHAVSIIQLHSYIDDLIYKKKHLLFIPFHTFTTITMMINLMIENYYDWLWWWF